MTLDAGCPQLSYDDDQEMRITVADVLQKLKDDLATQLAVLADTERAVQHLQVAIAAIERDEVESKGQVERQRPTSKRGYLWQCYTCQTQENQLCSSKPAGGAI